MLKGWMSSWVTPNVNQDIDVVLPNVTQDNIHPLSAADG